MRAWVAASIRSNAFDAAKYSEGLVLLFGIQERVTLRIEVGFSDRRLNAFNGAGAIVAVLCAFATVRACGVLSISPYIIVSFTIGYNLLFSSCSFLWINAAMRDLIWLEVPPCQAPSL